MKKPMMIFALLLSITAIISCTKNAADVDASLSASKVSSIQRGEPVDFSFKGSTENAKIEWNVTPAGKANITSAGNSARIQFNEKGDYVVTATDQTTTSRSTVSVDSSRYTGKVSDVVLDLKNSTFTFTPSIVDSMAIYGLSINIQSDNSYNCLNSYLAFSGFAQDQVSKVHKLNLFSVVQPDATTCQAGSKKVSANVGIYPLSDGDNKIEVSLNGNTYSGKIVKNGATITIDWPESSVIKFSKTTITK